MVTQESPFKPEKDLARWKDLPVGAEETMSRKQVIISRLPRVTLRGPKASTSQPLRNVPKIAPTPRLVQDRLESGCGGQSCACRPLMASGLDIHNTQLFRHGDIKREGQLLNNSIELSRRLLSRLTSAGVRRASYTGGPSRRWTYSDVSESESFTGREQGWESPGDKSTAASIDSRPFSGSSDLTQGINQTHKSWHIGSVS